MAATHPERLRLAETVRLAAAVCEQLREAVVVVGADGLITYANPAARHLFGEASFTGSAPTAAALLSRFRAAGTEDRIPLSRLPLGAALRGETGSAGDLELLRDGETVLVETSARPLQGPADEISGAVLSFVEITAVAALSRLQRERGAERNRFEMAQDRAPLGMAMLDLDGRLTHVNVALCRLADREPGELLGSAWGELLEAGERGDQQGLDGLVLPAGATDFRQTARMARADGRRLDVELTTGLIRNDAGEPLHQILLVQDITERIRQENLVADLNRTVAHRAREIEVLNTDLRRSNRDLEQFAYVASHDLSEPLRAVSGYVQLLARRYRGQLDSDADEFIGFAVDGVRRMQALIQDLLAYSRAGLAGDPVEVDCAALVGPLVERVRRDHPQATVEVGPMPTLVSEPGALAQVLENLVSNALKFVPPGRPPRVTLTSRARPDTWELMVTDNGIGIDPQHQERVFLMFQRLHPRAEYPGTGIGLAICARLAERLGGGIAVASAPGTGSRFTLRLPRNSGERP